MTDWGDVEKALIKYIPAALANLEPPIVVDRTATKVPPKVETYARVVRIARGPGSDDGITDRPLLDVETFTKEYADGYALADAVRQVMHALAGKRIGGVLVDFVSTSVAPAWVDYRNPGTERFVASYRIEFRKNYT